MNIEQLMVNKLKPLQTHLIVKSETRINDMRTTRANLLLAGFEAQAETITKKLWVNRRNSVLYEAMKKTGLKILVERPNFSQKRYTDLWWLVLKKAIRHRNDLMLYEVKAKDYCGDVPDFAVQATIKARDAGLKPEVWAVAKREELKDRYAHLQTLDPIVVGYPVVNEKTDYKYGLIVAMWGKDLEEINHYFEEQ